MWSQIFHQTGGLIGPAIIKNPPAFPASFASIASMFEGLRIDSSARKFNFIRGYVDGLEDYSLGERFLNSIVDFTSADNEMKTVIKRSFGGTSAVFGARSGMIVNGGLQWSDALQDQVIQATSGMVSEFGEAPVSVDITFFIGAYGATPFGVHVDDASHRTVLFNLGPEDKGMAVWENEQITQQFGNVSNISDVASIDAQPESYMFGSTQAFVLPSHRYHVGLNEGLSTVAAIVIDKVDDRKAAASEAQILFNEAPIDEEEGISSTLGLSGHELVHLHGLRLRSNSNLRYSLQRDLTGSDTLSLNTKFVTHSRFPIMYHPLDKGGIVYARGRHFLTPIRMDERCLGMLGSGDPFDIKQFLSHASGENTDMREQLKLLKFLAQSQAITEVE